MALVQCKACNGIYATTTADGGQYFHACPPVQKVQVLHLDGTVSTVDPIAVLPTDVVLSTLAVPGVGSRNENVIASGVSKGQAIAAGTGVKVLVP